MAATEWLTTQDLAAEFHVPEQTVRYWRFKGEGPRGTKFGRRVLYRRADVDAWAAAQDAAQNGPKASA